MEFRKRFELARRRAEVEVLPAYILPDGRYAVPSRQMKPGELRFIQVNDRGVGECDCPSYFYHKVCTHVAAVALRREREFLGLSPLPPKPEPARCPMCQETAVAPVTLSGRSRRNPAA